MDKNSHHTSNSIKKVATLEMPLAGIIIQTLIYAVLWFNIYYPLVRLRLKFYRRGHLLVLILYFILLLFFTKTYGGTNVGYMKRLDVSLSQVFSLLIVNFFTYLQDSLLRNWLLPFGWLLLMTLIQIVFAVFWIWLCDRVYKRVFPPTELLLIHGARSIEPILHKFATRPEKYKVTATMDAGAGTERVEAGILNWIRTGSIRTDDSRVINIGRVQEQPSGRNPDDNAASHVTNDDRKRRESSMKLSGADGHRAVVLWDLPTEERNELMKFCYAGGIRQYMMPKIPDVLIKGAAQLHLFDTPIYMTREYALSFEQRFFKRLIDIVCAAILLVITSPIFLVTAIAVKSYDHGPVFYKQVRCTLNGREFRIIKFRSMKVNAEKDGVARLASENDDRITPVGHFIRKCRIDELPQLINILKGDMSFIGPRPERPEIIRQYMEDMPEFAYRMKVKAGLGGYAQVYGKYNTTPYDKLKLDLTYIQNYSVGLDLKLMLLTLKILFTPDATEGVAEGQTTAMENKNDADGTRR